MNIEKILTRIFKHKITCEIRGVNWKRSQELRKDLKTVYEKSDLTPGELCDALEISMDTLSELLSSKEPSRCQSVWEQNLNQGLPLFVPIRLTGLS